MYHVVDLFYHIANLCLLLPVLPFDRAQTKTRRSGFCRANQTLTLLQYGWRRIGTTFIAG